MRLFALSAQRFVEFCNQLVYVDSVNRRRFFECFAVRKHTMQTMHTALLQYFCKFIGVALCKNVDDKHIFCNHLFLPPNFRLCKLFF